MSYEVETGPDADGNTEPLRTVPDLPGLMDAVNEFLGHGHDTITVRFVPDPGPDIPTQPTGSE